MKIGLALSGGAARGMAHIGVIKYLEEKKVPVQFVAGTSAGSLVGALYAAGLGAEKIEAIANEINWKSIIKNITSVGLPRRGFINTAFLAKIMEKYLGRKTFDELKKTFIAVGVDIENGCVVHMKKGDVISALMASCAIPGIFTPVERDGLTLVDGGVLQNLPCRPLVDQGMKTIIAVDLNAHEDNAGPPDNIFDIIYRSIFIMARERDAQESKLAKYYLAPNLGEAGFWELDRTGELIQAGYKEAKKVLDRANFKPGIWHKFVNGQKSKGGI